MGTYLITGASRGVGRCLIEQLAAAPHGHELIALGRSESSLSDLPVARRIVADLSDPGSLVASVPPIDRLDGIVHAAGIARRGDLAASSVEDWETQLRLNVIAVGELTRLLLPALRAAGGTVVLINSGQGQQAMPNSTVYAASKFALRALADALRAEEPSIRVSSIFPGRIDTDMQRALRAQEGGAYEPEHYLRVETVAQVIAQVLATPPDAVVTDLILRPVNP